MKKAGIVGVGNHGSRYANHIINDIDLLNLTAISRRSAEGAEQARGWGAKWYPDWRDLVHDADVEAVISVVPPVLNVSIARECAQAGKPLLLEKPLAVNADEALEIVEFMAARDCSLTVGQTLRYNPVVKSLGADIKKMGKIYSIHANQRLEPSSLGWHDNEEIAGAGVVIHTAVHIFDALHFITGLKVTRVMAASYKYHNTVLEDLVTILFEMEDGVVGTVDISKVGNARCGRYEFVCSKGQLHGDQVHGYSEVIRENRREQASKFEPIGAIVPLLKDWADFLHKKIGNPIKGEDGLYAVQVCDACLRSARKKRWVEV